MTITSNLSGSGASNIAEPTNFHFLKIIGGAIAAPTTPAFNKKFYFYTDDKIEKNGSSGPLFTWINTAAEGFTLTATPIDPTKRLLVIVNLNVYSGANNMGGVYTNRNSEDGLLDAGALGSGANETPNGTVGCTDTAPNSQLLGAGGAFGGFGFNYHRAGGATNGPVNPTHWIGWMEDLEIMWPMMGSIQNLGHPDITTNPTCFEVTAIEVD